MNEEARKELDRILSVPLHELTMLDKSFLNARRSYLTPSQLKDYSSVFVSGEEPVKEETPTATNVPVEG